MTEAIPELICTSCGQRIENQRGWVRFHCPQCGKETIYRCERCKALENQYQCSKCKFMGP